MKKLMLIALLGLCAAATPAQTVQSTKTVQGAVIDRNGNPLPGAVVEATGGAESTTVDADGTFSLEVPFWLKSLTVRYAGYPQRKKKATPYMMVVMKDGGWFLNLTGSVVFERNYDNGRLGLMAGYLGSWGGYLKVTPTLLTYGIPAVTAGVTKRLAQPCHLYLGAGFALVGYDDYYGYYYDDVHSYYPGAMFDIGFLFPIKRRLVLNLGYSVSIDPDGYCNHDLQFGIGIKFN